LKTWGAPACLLLKDDPPYGFWIAPGFSSSNTIRT
jgi:hypothetical protein